MAVSVVIGRPLRVLVVDADRIPVIGKFLDDPAVLRASGLDLKEVIRLADEPEIRGSEKCAFFCSEHQHPSFRRPLRGRWDVSINCFFISVCLLLFLPPFPAGSAMLNRIHGIIHSFLCHKMHKHFIRFLCNLHPQKKWACGTWRNAAGPVSCFIPGSCNPKISSHPSFPGRISAAPTWMRLCRPLLPQW